MKIYVASKSKGLRGALSPENVIEVCGGGPNPRGDANSYAYDETKSTGVTTYVLEVEVKAVLGYQEHKEVVGFVPTES